MQFEKTINADKINNIKQGLLTGLLIANCIFCRWGVAFLVKDITSQDAVIDLSVFKGDIVYAQACMEEITKSFPSCFSIENIDNNFFLIRFNDYIAGIW